MKIFDPALPNNGITDNGHKISTLGFPYNGQTTLVPDWSIYDPDFDVARYFLEPIWTLDLSASGGPVLTDFAKLIDHSYVFLGNTPGNLTFQSYRIIQNPSLTTPIRTAGQLSDDATKGKNYRDYAILTNGYMYGKIGKVSDTQEFIYFDSRGYSWIGTLIKSLGSTSLPEWEVNTSQATIAVSFKPFLHFGNNFLNGQTLPIESNQITAACGHASDPAVSYYETFFPNSLPNMKRELYFYDQLKDGSKILIADRENGLRPNLVLELSISDTIDEQAGSYPYDGGTIAFTISSTRLIDETNMLNGVPTQTHVDNPQPVGDPNAASDWTTTTEFKIIFCLRYKLDGTYCRFDQGFDVTTTFNGPGGLYTTRTLEESSTLSLYRDNVLMDSETMTFSYSEQYSDLTQGSYWASSPYFYQYGITASATVSCSFYSVSSSSGSQDLNPKTPVTPLQINSLAGVYSVTGLVGADYPAGPLGYIGNAGWSYGYFVGNTLDNEETLSIHKKIYIFLNSPTDRLATITDLQHTGRTGASFDIRKQLNIAHSQAINYFHVNTNNTRDFPNNWPEMAITSFNSNYLFGIHRLIAFQWGKGGGGDPKDHRYERYPIYDINGTSYTRTYTDFDNYQVGFGTLVSTEDSINVAPTMREIDSFSIWGTISFTRRSGLYLTTTRNLWGREYIVTGNPDPTSGFYVEGNEVTPRSGYYNRDIFFGHPAHFNPITRTLTQATWVNPAATEDGAPGHYEFKLYV